MLKINLATKILLKNINFYNKTRLFILLLVICLFITLVSPITTKAQQPQTQNNPTNIAQLEGLSTPAIDALKNDLSSNNQPNAVTNFTDTNASVPTYVSKSDINTTVTTLINPDAQFLELGRTKTFAGDGGPAINAEISSPNTIVADGKGGYYFTDTGNQRIRYVNPQGIISTVAGNGSDASKPNCWRDVKATDACLAIPHGIALDYDGGLIITDSFHHVISKVGSDGILRVIAGSGYRCLPVQSDCGVGKPALEASLDRPILARRTIAGLVIADTSNRVLLVKNGIMTVLAGTGKPGLSGDGGLATKADIFAPADVVPYRKGWLISDGNNCRLRWVDPQGIIHPFAGYGTNLEECWSWYGKVERTPGFKWGDAIKGDVGDGGSAINAKMTVTGFLAVVGEDVYITDWLNSRVRHITSDGKIFTTVGTGENPGTNGPGPMNGTQMRLGWACALAYDPSRNSLLLSDGGHRIMQVLLEPEKASPVDKYWLNNGGASGWMGPATGPETNGPSPNTRVRVYRSATVIWSQQTGPHVLYGEIRNKYNSLTPALKAQFGALLSDEEAGPGNGGRRSRFVGGDIYYTPKYGSKIIYGDIRTKYNNLNQSLKDHFGALTTDEEAGPGNGGRRSRFVGGDINFNPTTGTFEIYGDIRNKFYTMEWPTIRLGLQTSGEIDGVVAKSRLTNYQSGTFMWTPENGTKVIYGAIGSRYNSLPISAKQALGAAITDEIYTTTTGGRKSVFKGGTIYWTPSLGANDVYGGIWAKYSSIGAEKSALGFPTSGEKNGPTAGSRMNTFQKGTITWTPNGGTVVKMY